METDLDCEPLLGPAIGADAADHVGPGLSTQDIEDCDGRTGTYRVESLTCHNFFSVRNLLA